MYSVVLVMALAGSAEAPDCNLFGFCGCRGNWNSCGCFGRSYGGCQGCYGGCYGCGGCYGGGYYGGAMYGAPGAYYGNPANPMPTPEKIADPKKKDPPSVPTPGTIAVTVPPNTKLTVDGYVSNQNATERILVTPPIQPGEELTYTLVAETTLNGQLVSKSQQVTVRAGQFQPVRFNFTTADIVGN